MQSDTKLVNRRPTGREYALAVSTLKAYSQRQPAMIFPRSANEHSKVIWEIPGAFAMMLTVRIERAALASGREVLAVSYVGSMIRGI